MTRVIAAVEATPLAPVVCGTAAALARTLGADAEALHVREHGEPRGSPAALAGNLPLRLVPGSPIAAILAAAGEDDVLAVVLGARERSHSSLPVGHTVLGVLQGTTKPVVVVPPGAAAPVDRIRRVFVPLEGDNRSTRAVDDLVRRFRERATEVVVVHVFDEQRSPRFLDRPSRDVALWGDEFLLRQGQPSAGLRVARGAPGPGVSEATSSDGADLVLVSWSQRLEPGRAEVVRQLLETAPVPVLLVPADGDLRP